MQQPVPRIAQRRVAGQKAVNARARQRASQSVAEQDHSAVTIPLSRHPDHPVQVVKLAVQRLGPCSGLQVDRAPGW